MIVALPSSFEKFEENGELKIVFRTHNPIVLLRTACEGLGVV